ncbi:MAG: dihydroorotase [Gammaproteobacteria bacterium]|nr:dihydroorotase [Gammaproteobacteria bacterium]
MKITISGGRVVDPVTQRDEVVDVFIDGDTIVGLGRTPAGFKPARVIDARGCIVTPGFTEVGARLREPGQEHKATIASELEAAAAAGFTTVCCMPDTQPVIDTPAVVELVNQRARGVRGARVRCLGALTRDLGGAVLAEMAALKDIGCVGVANAGRAIRDSNVLKNALAYAATLDLTVFLDAEDAWLGAQGCMHEGAVSTRLGLPGIPAAAELVGLARDLVLIEHSGARAHFRTLSAGRSIKYLNDARKAGLDVTASVGIAHLALCDEDLARFDAAFHVRPPLRSRRDRTRLLRGLAEGQVEILTSHHEPHDADAKAGPFGATAPGISGLGSFLPSMLALVEAGTLDLMRAIDAAAVQPARVIGGPVASLRAEAVADICIFDPAADWTLDAEHMLSRGHNTPFLGRSMRGRVTATLVGGRVVFERKAAHG